MLVDNSGATKEKNPTLIYSFSKLFFPTRNSDVLPDFVPLWKCYFTSVVLGEDFAGRRQATWLRFSDRLRYEKARRSSFVNGRHCSYQKKRSPSRFCYSLL